MIDAIVRQSRHQFSADKDVYGPRFAKNMTQTFKLLFSKAPEADRQRLGKVLMLWQQNEVFKPDLVQPLLASVAEMGVMFPAEGLEMKHKEAEKAIPNEPRQRHEDTPPTPPKPAQTAVSLMPETNGARNVELFNQLQQIGSQFQPSGSSVYHHQAPPPIPNPPIQRPQLVANVVPVHQRMQNAPILHHQSIPSVSAPVQLQQIRNVPPPAQSSSQKQSGKNDVVTAVYCHFL